MTRKLFADLTQGPFCWFVSVLQIDLEKILWFLFYPDNFAVAIFDFWRGFPTQFVDFDIDFVQLSNLLKYLILFFFKIAAFWQILSLLLLVYS